MLFWVVTQCGLVSRYQLLEEHTVSVFRANKLSRGVGKWIVYIRLEEGLGWGEIDKSESRTKEIAYWPGPSVLSSLSFDWLFPCSLALPLTV
jgi:hypothetical protein